MNKKVSALSDQQLLSAYLSGDKDAISILIERHSKRVLDYIRMMVKNNEVADDIYQETFIKVVRFIDDGRYTDNGKFLSRTTRSSTISGRRNSSTTCPNRTRDTTFSIRSVSPTRP